MVDEEGNLLANRLDAKGHGKFTFTTDKDTKFELCFVSKVPEGVLLVWSRIYANTPFS